MCTSCNQKSISQNAWVSRGIGLPKSTEPIVCTYTLEDLETLLAQTDSNDNLRLSMLKSAVAMYSKNCKMFEDYVLNL